MVIRHHASRLAGEIAAAVHLAGSPPHFLHYFRRVLQGHALLVEACALASHHVQQDAVASLVALGQVLAPVLRPQCP